MREFTKVNKVSAEHMSALVNQVVDKEARVVPQNARLCEPSRDFNNHNNNNRRYSGPGVVTIEESVVRRGVDDVKERKWGICLL